MTDPIGLYTIRDIPSPEERASAQKKADARRAKAFKHTADFMNQVANTTIGVGFLTPLATWAFGVQNNPLSTGPQAAVIAVMWGVGGVLLHIFARVIVESFDL